MNVRLGQRIEEIRSDSTHGSSWLASRAVEAVVEAVQAGEDPESVARLLVEARPSIGAVAGALGRLLAGARTPEQLCEEARALLAARERATRAIAVQLHQDLAGTVMTHSASATAREAILHARPERVVCTVSEPVGEGRWLADELAAAGLAVDLVADDDAADAAAGVRLLLLGADTVFADGSFVNKVGTRRLAEAAHAGGVPVVVACEVIKLAPVAPADPTEERFELTQAALVARYVTEEGSFAPDEIAALVDRTPFLVEGYDLLRAPAR